MSIAVAGLERCESYVRGLFADIRGRLADVRGRLADVRRLFGDTRGRYCLFLFIAAEIIAGSIVELKADVSIFTSAGLDTLYVLLLGAYYLIPYIDQG
jgi:hypothetical protein